MDPRQVNADLIAAADAKRVDARRQDVTVSEAWAVYIEDRRYKGGSKNVNKWGERHLQDHLTLVRGDDIARKRGTGTLKPGPLAVLMPLKLKELDSDRVKE